MRRIVAIRTFSSQAVVMRQLLMSFALLSLAGLLTLAETRQTLAQIPVSIERVGAEFTLLRDGKPYEVHGVGGQERLELLAELGGNSIRTWSTDGLESLLDEAHRHGLTVCVGFWLGHERHGFNYQDQAAVLAQLEKVLSTVERFKSHPAVLIWAIGNEMEGSGENPAIWYAVDHIAREVKRIDPDHPTMTVIAELGEGGSKVKAFERFCPNVEILGINSYAGIDSIANRYREAGGTRPFLITEHGPQGPWEVGKTAWGSPLEATSTEKAEHYARGYRSTVDSAPECLGSYAFLWGHKQETTATWFGMLLPDGTRLGAADAMSLEWTGKPVADQCPRIEAVTISRAASLKPGETVSAEATYFDPESGELRVEWALVRDSGTIGVGGDAQAIEEKVDVEFARAEPGKVSFTVPNSGGTFRLFVTVFDMGGGAAVANIPLEIDAPVMAVAARRAELPFTVYSEGQDNGVYVPSGYMGNTAAISMTADCSTEPRTGEHCLKVEYSAGDQWGGVLWQSPPQDWEGRLPGGLNLEGATAVEFWARGEVGGEVVNFMLGVVDGDRMYRDTAKAELKEIRLTSQWQKYRISLQGLDLSRIKTGFGWSLAGQGSDVVFYLDDIRYVEE